MRDRFSLLETWKEVEALLGAILDREGGALPETSAASVREMLGHNELSLAWEELRDHRAALSAESRAALREAGGKMEIEEDEGDLHERALAETDDLAALDLWRELAARGNPEAPERLRAYARRDDPRLRDPARETLTALELSHDDPMP